MSYPISTARLQFHAGFTLLDALEVVPYLARLGISHVYASPLFTSNPGSKHGYDVIDVTAINPELGGRPGLDALVASLRAHNMGLILDIVPNHMASAAPGNAWFTDVLRLGRSSAFSCYFDIDWDSDRPELADKMLLPILAETYATALESGQLQLGFNSDSSQFCLRYFERHLPLAPGSLALLAAAARPSGHGAEIAIDFAAWSKATIETVCAAFDTKTKAGRERMHELLELQHYRLAFWQNASDEINWRRFFEISDLIGMRVERAEVFEATHALAFELYRLGLIDGLRVDHIDGLAAPKQYCLRLRARLAELQQQRPEALRDDCPVIWVEKILAEGEILDPAWQCDGTTGYEFMNDVLRVMMAPAGQAPLTQFWVTASADDADFDVYETRARRLILSEHLAGEFNRLCKRLTDLSNLRLETRDLTAVVISRVMFELLIGFRVYRCYVQPGDASPFDGEVLAAAAERARANLRPADYPALEFLLCWLGGELDEPAHEHVLRVILARFEQLSAPVAAKSVEDTAFYRYGRMLALNEVGGTPASFFLSLDAFHQRMLARRARDAQALSPLSTHDHKRGADCRARLAVLSERPDVFARLIKEIVLGLEHLTQSALVRITPVDLLMLLQTIVGAWPLDLDVDDAVGCARYHDRVAEWQQKALREAKQSSNWLLPNTEYEAAASEALGYLFGHQSLRQPLYQAVQELAAAGAFNSLAQVMLQCTAPGIPDIYQGTEQWDFSLVDPDNRRPVAFAERAAQLDSQINGTNLLPHWRDGRVKQWLIARLMSWRQTHAQLCQAGDYVALAGSVASDHLVAYLRSTTTDAAIVLVPVQQAMHIDASRLLIAADAWTGQTLTLPTPPHGSGWRNFLTGQTLAAGEPVAIDQFFKEFPIALITSG